jgi:hypothetical protein
VLLEGAAALTEEALEMAECAELDSELRFGVEIGRGDADAEREGLEVALALDAAFDGVLLLALEDFFELETADAAATLAEERAADLAADEAEAEGAEAFAELAFALATVDRLEDWI